MDSRVRNTTGGLATLEQQLATLQYSADTISTSSDQLVQALAAAGVNDPAVPAALNALGKASVTINSTRESINKGIDTVEQYMGDIIHTMQTDYQPPTETFQDTGRYIAIAVMFALTIIAALGAGFLSLKVNHPIWASSFVALLWLCVCLLMLLGVGLLEGVKSVSGDACLYAETYAVQYAETKVGDPQKKQWILNALGYYFNTSAIVPESPGSALNAVTGVDIGPVYRVMNSTEVTQLTTLVASLNTSQLTLLGLPGTTAAAVQNISTTLQPLSNTLAALDAQASRANVQPVYYDMKSLVCCDVSGASNDLWISWTVVGCVGLVLGVLTSFRIVRNTFKRKKAATRY